MKEIYGIDIETGVMRAEKDNPEQKYNDFWDWLLTGWHPIWLLSLVIAYVYYLMTTEEV